MIRDSIQELLEMGPREVLFRSWWEFKMRSGLAARRQQGQRRLATELLRRAENTKLAVDLPWEEPLAVAEVVAPRVPKAAIADLVSQADQATKGKILCFSRWVGDYGQPIDWHRDPITGAHWNPTVHWSKALQDAARVGDVKLTWEIGRFPQAFLTARASAFVPSIAPKFAQSLAEQLCSFEEHNPFEHGVHWHSSQEVAIRLVALLFAYHVFKRMGLVDWRLTDSLRRLACQSGTHIYHHIEYAQESVFNNHLIWEALGLYLAGSLLRDLPEAAPWVKTGKRILDQQAERQIYPDGGYIQQSHNYHRMAVQAYLIAWTLALARNEASESWHRAMLRSLDFLLAHQNPTDGRLPNYGANDGAVPCRLSTCDYADFRPTLQTLSILARGERIYDRGPWDEMPAWLLGVKAVEVPLRKPTMISRSFPFSGHYVLRGQNPDSFAAFRCGTLRHRFSQIDMLHLDVWWRGQNVLVDPGSYLYNGPARWHDHFFRTESHNTLTIDGRDQMLHWRKFKCLYWTRAKLLRFEEQAEWSLCEGEHYGYRRYPGNCVHRRSVLFVKDDLWVVTDHLCGEGWHSIRLHWLGGFASDSERAPNELVLITPRGRFWVSVFGEDGRPLAGDVVVGQEDPPRGWLSRYYGEKTAVPSFVVRREGDLPCMIVSVLCPGRPEVTVAGIKWQVSAPSGRLSFQVEGGRVRAVAMETGS